MEKHMSQIVAKLLMLVAGVLTLADPVILLFLWALRFKGVAVNRFSKASLWIGLTLSTIAFLLIWTCFLTLPPYVPGDPIRAAHITDFLRPSIAVSFLGVLFGFIGACRKGLWIAASAISVPLTWFLYAGMQ